jgi:TRAP-type C4-dicarboxylate transport system permease large subunit
VILFVLMLLRVPVGMAIGLVGATGHSYLVGVMLPPSTVLAVFAILTQQDIGKLFMAGIIPGLLAMLIPDQSRPTVPWNAVRR